MKSSKHTKSLKVASVRKREYRRKFSRAARWILPVLVAVKDRVRERLPVLPYHREPEYIAILGLADELVDAVIDDHDLGDARAAALLDAIGGFISSTYRSEPCTGWEEA